nr:hypothetical protein [Armatimonas sp.]
MNIQTPAPVIALEIGRHRGTLFFNGRQWQEIAELDGKDKQLLASIADMKPDTERPAAIYPTFRIDFGIVGHRRVALLHQKTRGSALSAALESSRLPETIKNLWPGQHTEGDAA